MGERDGKGCKDQMERREGYNLDWLKVWQMLKDRKAVEVKEIKESIKLHSCCCKKGTETIL